MSYDNFGPPPQHGHGHDQHFFDEPLIQFDVGPDQTDHIRPIHTHQTKTKGQRNNLGGLNNQNVNNINNTNNLTGANISNRRPEPVEIQYRGYVLRRAEPDRPGEELSWAKVTQNALSGSNAQLAEQSKRVRQETKTDALSAYSHLSREQHGVVERIIDKLQNEERVKNAVWVLDSVKKTKETKQVSLLRAIRSTSKIQIIVKRQDKNALKPGQKPIVPSQNAQYSGDIIDLSIPAPKKKPEVGQSQLNSNNLTQGAVKIGKAAKNQQRDQRDFLPPQQSRDDHIGMGPPPPPPPPVHQPFEDPFMPQGNHMMAGGLPDPFANVGQGPPFVESMPDRRPPQGNQQHNHQMPPPPPQFPPHNMPAHAPQPPGAIPIDDWDRHQSMPINHDQHRQNHHSRPPTLRGEFDDNPFRPNDDVFTPGGYELPLDMQNGRFDRSRPRARSFTPGPRYSSRDPSRDRIRDRSYDDDRDRMNLSRRDSRQEKRSPTNKKLERKITNLDDRMEEVISKIDDWRIQDVNRDRERERERDRERDRETRGRHRTRDQAHYGSSPSSSNSSDYDHNNPWTSAPASGGSWTPPSTPPLEYGTLARRKSHRRTSYNPHRDSTQLIVEGSPRHRRRQSDILPPALRKDPRPILHHAPTWNGNGPDYPPYPAAERPIRIRGECDEYERDRGYVEYAGGRPKYEGGRRRRDSMFVDGGRRADWDDRGERVMFVVDGGRRGRRSAYID